MICSRTKFAINFKLFPALEIRSASNLSVTVGTNTSEFCKAAISSFLEKTLSSLFNFASKSSDKRFSTLGINCLVTVTRGVPLIGFVKFAFFSTI